MMMVLLLSITVLALNIIVSEAANILYVIPFTSYSHYALLSPLGLELARVGHNVTVITAHKEKEHPPNYHEVIADDFEVWESLETKRPNVFTMVDTSYEEFYRKILWEGGLWTTEVALNSTGVKQFMRQDNKFDLVISELFIQEALYMFAHIYETPLVLITSYGNSWKTNFLQRNPLQLSTVIQEFSVIRHPMSFSGRLINLYNSIYELFWWYTWYMPQQERLVRKYFNDLPSPVPKLEELQRNASLILMNGHFSIDTPAAYLPNFVEVGGLHLKESNKKLPDDLQKVLDSAKEGVVYVNFGSNVKSSELPVDKREAFLKVFGRLKQTVLWKWEDTEPAGKPPNVEIRKWMPQREILAHKNIKVFIAHGGLLGLQEASYNGIPIIGVPIYADQYNNLLRAQDDGYGLILEYHTINEQTLEKALNKVLGDSSYQKRAEEISKRFRDRPMHPLNTSVFWIEYVIRHRGANFMKNPALQLGWLSFVMFDVYALIILCLVLLIVSLYKMLNYLIGMFTFKKGNKVKLK